MLLRNLVHCALAAAAALSGVALVFLKLGAQFVGLAQILIYVGAVAILALFAILLTRGGATGEPKGPARGWFWGCAAAGAVAGILVIAVLSSPRAGLAAGAAPALSVADLGRELMLRHVVALEAMGVLLTAALIGAVVVAMQEPGGPGRGQGKG